MNSESSKSLGSADGLVEKWDGQVEKWVKVEINNFAATNISTDPEILSLHR